MANNIFKVKRSSVPGKIPTTSDLSIGELGINLNDQILYSTNGSIVFEIGANNRTASVTGNLTVNSIVANGSLGTNGQVLTSNGTTVYWSTSSGSGSVTQVDTGNGLTGGPVTTTGTISVNPNTGIVANSLGLFVNAAYINTISANNAAYLSGQPGSYYTNATNITTGTLPYGQIPSNIVNTTANFTFSGVETFTGNLVVNAAIIAGGNSGTAGQVLTSNGSGNVYWSTAQTSSRIYLKTIASNNQNTFTTTNSFSTVDVYYNGVHLSNTDYVTVNNTTIQLGTNATNNAVIELVGYTGVNIALGSFTASGSNTQIQFNDGGNANGSTGFIFDKISNTVTIGGTALHTGLTYTTSGTSAQTIDSWLLSAYRSAQYFASVTDNAANNYQNGILQLIQDGTNVLLTEYATLLTNTSIGTFSATSNTTHALLQFTPVSTNTTINISRTLITV